jgi:nucleotide-binding universal stress UspA family protein
MAERTIHATLKFTPPMIRTVLVALDYEPSAQYVAEMGYTIATGLGADLALMHVVADYVYYTSTEYSPVMGFSGFNSADVMEQVGVEELKIASLDYLSITKHHLGDDNIRTLVAEGDTTDAILKTASDIGAGLIVLGSHNRRGIDKMIMGNTAEEILRKTSVPIIVVPTKEFDKSHF